MKASKKTLTLSKLEKYTNEANKYFGKSDSEFFVLVNKKLAKKIDKLWDKLPWFIKLEINLKRLIHGMGFYRKSGVN